MKIYFVEKFIEDCGADLIYFTEDDAKMRFLELKTLCEDEEEICKYKIFEAEVKETSLAQTN